MNRQNEKDRPLSGKVALIINGMVSDGRSLAISMADYGADIALVCLPGEKVAAQEVKQLIEDKGQRCLLIVDAQLGMEGDKRDLFGEVVDHFGRMDFFINYATQQDGDRKGSNQTDDGEGVDDSGILNFNLLKAVFKRIKLLSNQSESFQVNKSG